MRTIMIYQFFSKHLFKIIIINFIFLACTIVDAYNGYLCYSLLLILRNSIDLIEWMISLLIYVTLPMSWIPNILNGKMEILHSVVTSGFIYAWLVFDNNFYALSECVSYFNTAQGLIDFSLYTNFFELYLLALVDSYYQINHLHFELHPMYIEGFKILIRSDYLLTLYFATEFIIFAVYEYTASLVWIIYKYNLLITEWFFPIDYSTWDISYTSKIFNFARSLTEFFMVKFLVFIAFVVIIRSGTPRYRFDYLTKLGWLKFLGFSLTVFIFVIILYFLW